MIKGITVNGLHSYQRFGLRMLSRNIGAAAKDEYTERVPFSSVTHDFSRICGEPSFGERTLTYTFEFLEFRTKTAEENIFAVMEWLCFADRQKLWDDMLPNHFFEVREPTVSFSESHGVHKITAVFKANPVIGQNPNLYAAAVNFPDIDGDGIITAADAAMVLEAYTKLSSGEDTGLTDAQLRACDADMDGKITASDATLVVNFYAEVQNGAYYGDADGWADYLRDVSGKYYRLIDSEGFYLVDSEGFVLYTKEE